MISCLNIIVTHFFKGCTGQTPAGRGVLEAGRVQDKDGVVDVARGCRDGSAKNDNILDHSLMTSRNNMDPL